jgi:hypothetical protein
MNSLTLWLGTLIYGATLLLALMCGWAIKHTGMRILIAFLMVPSMVSAYFWIKKALDAGVSFF